MADKIKFTAKADFSFLRDTLEKFRDQVRDIVSEHEREACATAWDEALLAVHDAIQANLPIDEITVLRIENPYRKAE